MVANASGSVVGDPVEKVTFPRLPVAALSLGNMQVCTQTAHLFVLVLIMVEGG